MFLLRDVRSFEIVGILLVSGFVYILEFFWDFVCNLCDFLEEG